MDDTWQRVLRTAQELGYQTVQQRYQAPHQQEELPIREKRIGIAQMFETQQPISSTLIHYHRFPVPFSVIV